MAEQLAGSGRLAGKIAVVTGAASNPGIGRSIAHRFAAEGAKLIVSDIDLPGVEKCAQEIIDAGGEAIPLRQDVTQEQAWIDVMAKTIEAYGRLDVMVNNAGIAELKKMVDIDLQNWNRHIEINLTSVFLGSKYAALEMRKCGGGSIINMSSVAGIIGTPACVAYGATKGGVRTMSKSIAVEECEHDIRCNTIHPGFIWTNMQARDSGKSDPSELVLPRMHVPLGRPGMPEDVANVALFLASDEANYVTGAEYVVDAGLTCK